MQNIDAIIEFPGKEIFLYKSDWLESASSEELSAVKNQFNSHFEECLLQFKEKLGEPAFTEKTNPKLAQELYLEAMRMAAWEVEGGFLVLAFGQHDKETPMFVSFGLRRQDA